MPETPAASVVITTRNRRDELRAAVTSALAQKARIEVLVVDDGSSDGSAEMIASEFPRVHLCRSEQSKGLVVQRNAGAALASAPIVVSIDDDAVFVSSDTVAQTVAEFDHPRVGAVAIPYRDGPQDGIRQASPSAGRVFVAARFRGTAYAVRRDLFLRLGGFREVIFHQGEERDLCLRMLEAGYVTRLGAADPIVHNESPSRDLVRMDLYGRRNDILCSWHNDPLPFALLRMLEMTVKGLGLGLKVGRPLRMLQGLALGYRACWEERHHRRPVSRAAYRLDHVLRREGPRPLEQVEPLLEELGASSSRT
ncbi:MAG: glycosyltransferase family 2 protein [Gaiellaceae bacterium]